MTFAVTHTSFSDGGKLRLSHNPRFSYQSACLVAPALPPCSATGLGPDGPMRVAKAPRGSGGSAHCDTRRSCLAQETAPTVFMSVRQHHNRHFLIKKGPSLPAAHQVSAYRCSLPGLAGFTASGCAGPGPI